MRGVGTSYIWHSTDVHAEWPPFFKRCQVYDWPPFFNKKYMNDPIFLDSYVKGPIFLTTWYIHIFFVQRFFEAACSLGIQWIDCDIQPAINGYKKINGQCMNRSTFWMIKYMNGSVFFTKARHMNGVGFASPPPPGVGFDRPRSNCLDMLFTIEYCPSEWYSTSSFKKSQCATVSDSDQPVLIRLAKSESLLVTLWSGGALW